ncbi:MAG: dTDP-4-dehydrorhamnose reductase [Phycisphaerales bacterium]|nr:dTDP-4-dehydrorhamnose reductase [Phycisphaerales bacterium]
MTDEQHSIAIIGNLGMLARSFEPLLTARSVSFHGFDLPQFDMTDAASVSRTLCDLRPTVVINCAAYTDVDGAESEEDKAMRINRDGPANLAAACLEIGATLVHYSTDYVFNGQATTPYPVDTPIEPVNAYGRTKAAGEAAIIQSGCSHIIIRSSWLYAAHGNNFVRTIAKLAKERDRLQVVNDQRGRPTACPMLAETTLLLLDVGARGVYHVAGEGEATWYDFAKAIAAAANPSCDVRPCSSDTFPRPAPRPAYSVLDLTKTIETVGVLPHWKESLADVLRQLGYDRAAAPIHRAGG